MLGLTLREPARARKLRAVLTALAIVLGVAMISGTFVLTGQIDRAFREIFDAGERQDRRRRSSCRDRQRQQRRLRRDPFPDSVLTHGRKRAAAWPRPTGEIDALGSLVTSRTASPSASLRGGAPPLVFSHAAGALRSGDVRPAGTAPRATARSRSIDGHGRQGRRRRRRATVGLVDAATASSACASSASTGSARRPRSAARLVMLDPARGRAAAGTASRASSRRSTSQADAGRLARRAARPHPRGRSATASRCRPAPRRRRPTRRASPTRSTASSARRCSRSAASRCSSAPSSSSTCSRSRSRSASARSRCCARSARAAGRSSRACCSRRCIDRPASARSSASSWGC